MGPHIFEAYVKKSSEKRETDAYIMLILGYNQPSFRDFENFLRFVVGLEEYDVQLILTQYISNFRTFETPSGFYSIKVF